AAAPNRKVPRRMAWTELCLSPGVVDQYRDTAATRHGQVGQPASPEIVRRDGGTALARKVYGGLEAAIPLTQQHRDITRIEVGHGQVQDAVAIEVVQDHESRSPPGAEG